MKGPLDSISISEVKLIAQALKKLCENLTGHKSSLQNCLHQASKLFGFQDFHQLSAYAKNNDIDLVKASHKSLKFFDIEIPANTPYEIEGFSETMEQLNNLGINK